MSDRREKPSRSRRHLERVLGILVMAFVGIFVLMMIGFAKPIVALLEILWHLTTGFVSFSKENLRKLSSDAGTWGPGLAAFVLALAIIQWFGTSWARRRDQSWRISNTLALGMTLPLLFTISFLVPGTLLQVGSLQQLNWFQSNRPVRAHEVMNARNIAVAAHVWATTKGSDRFPASTEVMMSPDYLDAATFMPQPVGDAPGDPPLYLGAGLTIQSDPALPLVISGTYSRNRDYHCTVITVGGDVVDIRVEELNDWIAKAMAAREGVKP